MTAPELPSFRKPPVTEVVLAVAFDPLLRMQTPQLGLLWDSQFRARFPKVDEQAPVDPMFETFSRRRQEFMVSFEAGPPPPRLWFLTASGDELLQVQRNWFARNWRKISDADEYPRYSNLKAPFAQDLNRFINFLDQEKLGDFVPAQCEVTYINHIYPSGLWRHHGELGRILNLVGEAPRRETLNPEQIQVAAQWLLECDGEVVGRLHLSAAPGFTADKDEPIYVMTLTARGRPLVTDIEGVLKFMDVGHEAIVRSFDALTTNAAHREWEKENV